ncbi:MAG: hypothetical protein CL942_08575 [Desulfovibrio sp.]|nr:hypothetical protein [Desulfovibrio sp.]|tara:strand:+ start:420 stop:1103 length:684 start_codon:yes stop_codon:yes gene_type:complete
MPDLKIKKGSFKIRFAPGEPMTEANEGDTITLTDEQVEHWYTQAAINEGRAVEQPDSDDEDDIDGGDQDSQGDSGDDPETTLNLVQRSELEATATKLADETAAREQAESKLADEVTAHGETKTKLADETQARERAEDELTQEVEAHNETKAKLAELEAAGPAEEDPAGDQGPEDLESKMLAVFPKLTADDYKTDGTPKVKSVETLLGENVTADQVSAAWAKFQEGQE